MQRSQKRRVKSTLIKHEIGQVKLCSYAVPLDKPFGKVGTRDDEGAGSLLSNWDLGTPSASKQTGRSFVETNRRAIRHHAVTPADFRAYGQQHMIRQSKSRGGSQRRQVPPEGFVFGKKNDNFDESIAALVQADHTTYDPNHFNYPDMTKMKQHGKIPRARGTKASRGQDRRYDGITTRLTPRGHNQQRQANRYDRY
jgi:hypothetical protein